MDESSTENDAGRIATVVCLGIGKKNDNLDCKKTKCETNAWSDIRKRFASEEITVRICRESNDGL